ncbi:MAG: hypothetical protein U0230_17485 [Polyangiales bacterium]
MPASKVERVASGCLLAFFAIFCGGISLFLLLAAFFGTSERERPVMIALLVPMSLFILVVPIGVLALQRLGNTRANVVAFLEGIAERTRGKVELPSFLLPAAAARVDCEVGGRPVEIRILRQTRRAGSYVIAKAIESEHARLGARYLLATARVHAHLARPMPLRLVFATRSRLGAMGASLVGVTEILTGDAAFDERFVLVTNQPEAIRARILGDAGFRQGLVALVQQNPPYATNVTIDPSGLTWLGMWSEDLGPEKVAYVVAQLGALGELLGNRDA